MGKEPVHGLEALCPGGLLPGSRGPRLSPRFKIENAGTVPLIDPTVEVYLAPARLTFDGAVLVQRAKVRGKIPSGGTLQVKLKNLKSPRGAPAGTYYLGYFLRDPKDAYQDNNTAWGLEVSR